MQQEKSPSMMEEIRATFNIAYFVALAHASCLTPFLRHGFGRRYFGVNGFGAFIVLLLAVPATQDPGMVWFFWAWVVALLGQRMRTVALARRGVREHSQYGGWPWLAMLVPGISIERKAKDFEPFLCGALGLGLMPLAPGVGGFVMMGFLSLAMVNGMEQAAMRRQVTAMRDLELEQRYLSECVRNDDDDF